ncbi:antibiotic biosynthesis monooxygenase [Robbsia sp. KACC 23696]|uniref:putative quinol monooxygenase n=1 Tax=Robbsia sp. KACC 23696 TaxID=3149231 RepID=UPI00325AEDF1
MSKPYFSFFAVCSPVLASVAMAFSGWTVDANAATTPADAKTNGALYAVVHVDVEPKDLSSALPILTTYAQRAAADPAVRHIDVLQQDGGTNHFTLLEAFRSQAAYQQFVAQSYVKQMRERIQPMLGSPFDERLHSAVVIR